MPEPTSFYDDLSSDYHLVYPDWRSSVRRQGDVLGRLIRRLNPDAMSVLDCTCGIGTQSIGLALQGFDVHGTDISTKSVERAREEVVSFGVTIKFDVADVRHLAEDVEGSFDVVISCDNSLPHLLTESDLRRAVGGMYRRLAPGGLLVIGIRDYDALRVEQRRSTPPLVTDSETGRSILFQVWDWDGDGERYTLNFFVVHEHEREWETVCHSTRYRALRRRDLDAIIRDTGFGPPEWYFPSESGHHQPLVTARRTS